MRRALLLVALLAACGREAPAPPPAAPSFREAGAPIASTTRCGPFDMAGEWVVSAAFPGAPLASPGTALSIAPGTDMAATWTFASRSGPRAVPTAMTAPGRYEGAAERFWILWVDDDFRTAAVGTPDGTFGWIMDRPGEASPDRARAAAEMLDFNGYDVGRLSP